MRRTLTTLALLTLWAAPATAQEADLAVTADANYGATGEVDLEVTVANNGPDDVLDVDILGEFAAATVLEADNGCSEASAGVACNFTSLDTPVLAAGDERVVTFRIQPDAGATDATFSVSSTVEDPNATNDRAVVPLIRPVRVDVAIDEHGIDAGPRKTLVFDVTNDGPDTASNVRASGTVTVDFDSAKSEEEVRTITGMNADDAANCGRQVPQSSEPVARWTFPVSCSIADLDVGQVVEFEFWFEEGSNALFRMSAESANLDEDQANNVTDGSFLNSPLEYVDVPDEGCCAVIAPRGERRSGLFLAGLLVFGLWRRRSYSRT